MSRFAIRYSVLKGALLTLLGIPRRWAYVELDDALVTVRLGWTFRARFPRHLIVAAKRGRNVLLTAGAHGWRGRWLVNGAGTGIVEVHLADPARAWVVGFPVRLRVLAVSLDDPDGFLAALGVPDPGAS